MEQKGMTLSIVLLVAGLIVGGGIGFYMAPVKTVYVNGPNQSSVVTTKITVLDVSHPTSQTTTLHYSDGKTLTLKAFIEPLKGATYEFTYDSVSGALIGFKQVG